MTSVQRFKAVLSNGAIIKLAGGQVAALLINILALPVLTRLYSPGAFGSYAVTLALSAILIFVATLGLSGVIPTLATKSNALCFAGALITSNLVTGIVGLILSGIGLASGVLPREIAVCLGVASVVAMTSGWFLTVRALCNRYGMHNEASLAQAARAAGFAVAACCLALIAPGHLGDAALALAVPLGDVAVLAWMTSTFAIRERSRLLALSPKRAIRQIQKQRPLLVSAGTSHFFAAIMQSAPPIFIGAFYGAAGAGLFGLAQRVVVLPTTILGASVGTYLSVSLSKSWHRGDDIGPSVRLIVFGLSIVSLFGFGLLALLSQSIVPIIFGAEWSGAAPAIRTMAILGGGLFVTSAISFLPLLTRKYRELIMWTGLRLMAMVLVAFYCWASGSSFIECLMIYAACEMIFLVSFALFFTVPKSLVALS